MTRLMFRPPPEFEQPLLRGLARISWVNIITAPMAVAVLALLGRDMFVDGFLLPWTVGMAVVYGVIQGGLLAVRKAWWQRSIRGWANAFMVTMFVSGVGFAIPLLAARPGSQESVNLLVTAFLMSASTASTVSHSGSKRIAGAFLGGLWGTAGAIWASQGELIWVAVAIAIAGGLAAYHHLAFLLLVRGELARARAEDLANDMAVQTVRDALTRTLNRHGILVELEAILAGGFRPGILFLDLDGFKAVNDTLGHNTGDELLCAVADEIQIELVSGEILGRLGGDEFIVVAPECSRDELLDLGTRLVRAIRARCSMITALPVTASMGVAMAADGDTAGELMHRADMAMYDAKANGGNGLVELGTGDWSSRQRHEIMERELRFALVSRQIDFHVQPIVCLRSGSWRAVELLARWTQPGAGAVSPATFIPIVEELKLDRELGLCAIDAAAEVIPSLDDETRVSVNITSRHFVSGDLLADVLEAAETHGVDPSRFIIEITESQTLSDLELAADIARGIRGAGIGLAIDDFGTGYSSLMLLGRLPVTSLKLAPEFGRDVDDESGGIAVRHLVSWSDALGIELVVEGVEDQEIADLLHEAGVEMAQGYLFARPAPLAELQAPDADLDAAA